MHHVILISRYYEKYVKNDGFENCVKICILRSYHFEIFISLMPI